MKVTRIPVLLIVLLLLTALGLAAEREEQVKFAAGKSSATLKRGIARGETMRFLLDAGKGQTMSVSVTSVEHNAVFEVIGDGGPLGKSKLVDGYQEWTGKLPIKGTYAIVVGSERGGSEFTLEVGIR